MMVTKLSLIYHTKHMYEWTDRQTRSRNIIITDLSIVKLAVDTDRKIDQPTQDAQTTDKLTD